MGFISFAVGGLGFILIGVCEALSSSTQNPNPNPNPTHDRISTQTSPISSSKPNRSLSLIFASLLSSLFILDSLYSFFDALNSGDRVGSVHQLQTLAVASLFLLHALVGALIPQTETLVESISLFAFAEEFLLFRLQRKDTAGIENRYYDLLLVPISICAAATVLRLISSDSSRLTKFSRGMGLILQGMWFVQMAVSLHTGMVAHGCSIRAKSRGNYTVKCKGHSEYHRARAIATLQFNTHLAVIVVVGLGLYSVFASRNGGEFETRYRPIAAEMRAFEDSNQFTLDSDDDDGNGEILKEQEKGVVKIEDSFVEHGLNGHHVCDNL